MVGGNQQENPWPSLGYWESVDGVPNWLPQWKPTSPLWSYIITLCLVEIFHPCLSQHTLQHTHILTRFYHSRQPLPTIWPSHLTFSLYSFACRWQPPGTWRTGTELWPCRTHCRGQGSSSCAHPTTTTPGLASRFAAGNNNNRQIEWMLNSSLFSP